MGAGMTPAGAAVHLHTENNPENDAASAEDGGRKRSKLCQNLKIYKGVSSIYQIRP
jgi:hypothetical protein